MEFQAKASFEDFNGGSAIQEDERGHHQHWQDGYLLGRFQKCRPCLLACAHPDLFVRVLKRGVW